MEEVSGEWTIGIIGLVFKKGDKNYVSAVVVLHY